MMLLLTDGRAERGMETSATNNPTIQPIRKIRATELRSGFVAKPSPDGELDPALAHHEILCRIAASAL